MSLLAHLKRDDSIQGSTDRAGYTPLTTNVYPMVIELAYITTSKGGATGIVFSFKSPEGSHRETVYVTSGLEKGQLPYYVDQRSGEKKYLPGYILASDIVRLAVDKELNELETEEKVVNIYNVELKKEAPTKVQMLTELLGTEIKLGLVQVMQDKYKEPTTSITTVQIDKVFHAEAGLTVTEAEAGLTEGEFINTWLENNLDKVQDRRKLSKGGSTVGATGSGMPSHQPDAPKKSLFGKKS